MKITIRNRKDLMRVLNTCSKAIQSKVFLPALECFHITVENNSMTVLASNTENSVFMSCPVESEDNGVFCINAKAFRDAVALIDGNFTIEIDKMAKITYASGSMDLPITNEKDYPIINKEVKGDSFTIKSSDLYDLYANAKLFCGSDELRPTMMGVYNELSKNILKIASTDTLKLFFEKMDIYEDKTLSFILPSSATSMVLDLLKDSNEVSVSVSEKNVLYTTLDGGVIARLIEGKYPNAESIAKKKLPIRCKVDKTEAINAIKRCQWGADQSSSVVILSYDGTQFTATSENLNFGKKVVEKINATPDADFRIGFNADLLLMLLNNITSDSLVICFDENLGLSLEDYNKNDRVQFLCRMMIV